MNRKSVIACGAIGLICAVVLISFASIKNAKADFVDQANMYKSVNILDNDVLLSGSAKFNIIDFNATTSLDIVETLPPISGNNGLVEVYKVTGDVAVATVFPANGDHLENGRVTSGYYLHDTGQFVTFLADEANGTWWVISQGSY